MTVRLDLIGVDLARALHPPAGAYCGAIRRNDMIYVSGHGPLLDGKPMYQGKIPTDLSVDEGYAAARLTAINCLATIDNVVGSLDRIVGFVKLFGMVNADATFAEHPKVIDGASDLLVEVFGDDIGAHARSAVGMGSLPFGIPVEIEMIVALG